MHEQAATSPDGRACGAASHITPGGNLETLLAKANITLLFAVGTRPSACDVERSLAAATQFGASVRTNHCLPDEHGWLELHASGLFFDIAGLAPGATAPVPPVGQVYGLPADVDKFEFEAIALALRTPIEAAEAKMSVIRTLMELAVNLALQLPVTAVCWSPARSWMDPKFFSRIIVNWLSGGPFPVLGLAGVWQRPDGVVESSGLAFFIGQEVCVADREGEPGSETVKLATRIINDLLRNGPLEQRTLLSGPDGETLIAKPSADRRLIVVSRGG